jgi:hypothetical protein
MSNWYYYDNNGQKQCPISGGKLKGLSLQGVITPETIVENEEGKSVPARKVQGLTFADVVQSESANAELASGTTVPTAAANSISFRLHLHNSRSSSIQRR